MSFLLCTDIKVRVNYPASSKFTRLFYNSVKYKPMVPHRPSIFKPKHAIQFFHFFRYKKILRSAYFSILGLIFVWPIKQKNQFRFGNKKNNRKLQYAIIYLLTMNISNFKKLSDILLLYKISKQFFSLKIFYKGENALIMVGTKTWSIFL